MTDPIKAEHLHRARAVLRQATGGTYQIGLEHLDGESLREFCRLIRDLQDMASHERKKRKCGQFW